MITYEKKILQNGLTVLFNKDVNTPMAAVNTIYKVGSRNEFPDKTGFAHLFEHLMFGGSQNVPQFDIPLQAAAGEDNAFTNDDSTNYYEVLPKENIETALWVESDRMRNLNINKETLALQQKVVVEEFKQRYLNQPYGDL
ncbi:MAG: insulinase family protein, partial [Rikenellaceae bacterium]